MTTFKPDETMLHNYLQNKLSPQDEEQLELWLADHPEVLEDLELDLMMKEGIEIKSLVYHSNQAVTKNKMSKLSSQILKVSLVLNFLAVATIFVIAWIDSKNDSINFSRSSFVELDKQRGINPASPRIVKENSMIVVRFFPDNHTEKYHLNINSLVHDKSILINDLKAEDQFAGIAVSISSSKLSLGKWEILIFDDNGKQEQRYFVEIQK